MMPRELVQEQLTIAVDWVLELKTQLLCMKSGRDLGYLRYGSGRLREYKLVT